MLSPLAKDNLPLQADSGPGFTGDRSQTLKIGFVLLSNSSKPAPSTRIAALNMFPFLRQANFEPEVVFEPPAPCETPDLSSLFPGLVEAKLDIVVFQKVRTQRRKASPTALQFRREDGLLRLRFCRPRDG